MMTSRMALLSTVLLGAPLALTACSFTDPENRVGPWHPRGINDGNLATMIVDPQDLVYGRRLSMTDGVLAAAAVDRLYRDKVKPLADTGLALTGVGVGASASSGSTTDPTP